MVKPRFTKEDRSTFSYWFAHWCAFNLTALNLKLWKPKYLLHDIEKPFLKLIWEYPKVQKYHRTHNSHHLEYYQIHGKADWETMMIDWECSGMTKVACPLDARGEMNRILNEDKFPAFVKHNLEMNMKPILDKLEM